MLALPLAVSLASAGDLKLLADALAEAYFKETNKLEKLEISIINIIQLPV